MFYTKIVVARWLMMHLEALAKTNVVAGQWPGADQRARGAPVGVPGRDLYTKALAAGRLEE